MGRRNRTEIENRGAIYHIIGKGVEGTNIFTDDADKNKFLHLLQKMFELHKIHLFSYVLMDTHFHLLLKTEEANLSQAMQFLNSSYAHWFNIRHIRKGHLFQDRYKSHLVLNPLYLYSVASYISLNPVEARLVDSPEEYPWSSFQYFIQTRNKFTPSWLKIDKFLTLSQSTPDNFINFVKENHQKDNLVDYPQDFNKTTSGQIKNKIPENIEKILEKAKKTIGDIKNNKRLKSLLIFLLINEGYTIKDIATSFNLSRQSVQWINQKMEKKLISDRIHSLWLNQIKEKLLS
jgi:REP element-mobilizing transposase RayT/AraC-like DNA-binding protein